MSSLKRDFLMKLNFSSGRPSSASVVTFPSHTLCSIVSRRNQKNTKLPKTNTKKCKTTCNNYKSKVKTGEN